MERAEKKIAKLEKKLVKTQTKLADQRTNLEQLKREKAIVDAKVCEHCGFIGTHTCDYQHRPQHWCDRCHCDGRYCFCC